MRKKIIAILLIFVLLQVTFVYTYATTQSDLNSVKDKLNKANTNNKKVTAAKETILNEISDLEEEIAEYEKEIKELNSKITKMEKNIKEKNKEIEELQKDYDEKKQLLEDRLVAIYEQGRITFLDVLLASDNIWDYISMSSKVQQLTDADNEQMDKVEAQREEVKKVKNDLEKQKKELAEDKQAVQSKQTKIKLAKTSKEAKVETLTKEQKDIQTEINKYKKSIAELEAKLKEEANKNGSSYTGKFTGTLSWPLSSSSYGYNIITSYYGSREEPCPGATGWHPALDIGVSYQPVYSAAAGVVVSKGYNIYRGNYVMVKHADNLFTFYQHLDSISVSTGQKVARAQKIAVSGSTGIGTGPHLHFEVRTSADSSSTVNPLKYCHW